MTWSSCRMGIPYKRWKIIREDPSRKMAEKKNIPSCKEVDYET